MMGAETKARGGEEGKNRDKLPSRRLEMLREKLGVKTRWSPHLHSHLRSLSLKHS